MKSQSETLQHVLFVMSDIIIIIIFINCNWVVTRWQLLFYMYTNMNFYMYTNICANDLRKSKKILGQ